MIIENQCFLKREKSSGVAKNISREKFKKSVMNKLKIIIIIVGKSLKQISAKDRKNSSCEANNEKNENKKTEIDIEITGNSIVKH